MRCPSCRDDPTILAWSIANEPECPGDRSCAAVARWVGQTSRFLKSLDPHHLVTVDSEGFLGPSTPGVWVMLGGEGMGWSVCVWEYLRRSVDVGVGLCVCSSTAAQPTRADSRREVGAKNRRPPPCVPLLLQGSAKPTPRATGAPPWGVTLEQRPPT